MSIGQEIVFRVSATPKGYKVTERDGTGLADGIFAKARQRYFYEGDYADAEARAHEYAHEHAEKTADNRDALVRVVELGEKVTDGGTHYDSFEEISEEQ